MTAPARDYDNPKRDLPARPWTDVDSIQNFAQAALGQAERFRDEAYEERDESRARYFEGAAWYARVILNYVKNTGIDADIKAATENN